MASSPIAPPRMPLRRMGSPRQHTLVALASIGMLIGLGCSPAKPAAKQSPQREDTGTLRAVTPTEARALVTSHDGGFLNLDSLTTLSDDVAQALVDAQTPATVDREHSFGLSLNGLTTLSPETARILVAWRGELSLFGLHVITPETAAALAAHSHAVHLGGLAEVDPASLESLRSNTNIMLPERFTGPPAP